MKWALSLGGFCPSAVALDQSREPISGKGRKMDTKQMGKKKSGPEKLVAVALVLLLPVIGLALLMPAVQSVRRSAVKRSLEYCESSDLPAATSAAGEADKSVSSGKADALPPPSSRSTTPRSRSRPS